MQQIEKYEIPEIDLVIVDLYPFEATVASGAEEPAIIEKIDIGGISLLRAVSLIVNLVDRLPVVHTLNHAGGALIGAVSCALFLTVLMGLLVKSGAMEQSSFGGPVAQLLRSIAERIV